MAMILLTLVWRLIYHEKRTHLRLIPNNEVDTALAAPQNTLTVIDPMNLGTLVAGYSLLVGSNIIPGLSVQLPLTLTRHENNYLMIGVSTSIFNQAT